MEKLEATGICFRLVLNTYQRKRLSFEPADAILDFPGLRQVRVSSSSARRCPYINAYHSPAVHLEPAFPCIDTVKPFLFLLTYKYILSKVLLEVFSMVYYYSFSFYDLCQHVLRESKDCLDHLQSAFSLDCHLATIYLYEEY